MHISRDVPATKSYLVDEPHRYVFQPVNYSFIRKVLMFSLVLWVVVDVIRILVFNSANPISTQDSVIYSILLIFAYLAAQDRYIIISELKDSDRKWQITYYIGSIFYLIYNPISLELRHVELRIVGSKQSDVAMIVLNPLTDEIKIKTTNLMAKEFQELLEVHDIPIEIRKRGKNKPH